MFSDLVKKSAPWSISKTGVLGLCPRQYNFKYNEKLKETTKSSSGRLGVILHSVTETVLKKPNINVETIIEDIKEKEKLSLDEELAVMEKINSILNFSDRISKFKTTHKVHTELIEQRLAINTDFSKAKFEDNTCFLRGLIDYGMITQDNVLIIIDHKTGRKKPIAEHNAQFFTYMLLALAEYDVKAIQCGINYTKSDKIDWQLHKDGSTRPWLKEEINIYVRKWLVNYLNSFEQKLLLLDQKIIKPKTGWQCEYCGFADKCEEGQKEIEIRVKNRAEKEGQGK